MATAPCDGVQGIHIANDRLWVAQHHQIAAYDRDFAFEEIVATDAGFNDLHSLRPSGAGLLIASTGTDSIVELDGDGEIVWRWWATENGFSVDSFGEPRSLDTAQDHRKTLVDTWLRTTHVNSAVSFGESTVLATLFHQGQLVAIGKRTGRITVVVDGLARPHAARWSGDTLTLADTARGRALYGRMREGDFEPQGDVSIPTGWLQDCQLVEDQWILVDGENARVYFTDLQGDVIAVDQFDAEWLLYEVAFLSG